MNHISYMFGGKITVHFLKLGGRTTVCGRVPEGEGWTFGPTGHPKTSGIVCRKCTQSVELGVSRLFSCCPKCLGDLGQQIPLSPDRSCPNCRSRWN